MKIPVPVVLAIAALSVAALSCGDTGTYASLKTSVSPATFKSVGETLTFTYTVDAGDYIDKAKSYGITDQAADTTPACSPSQDGKQLVCKATHAITAEDAALGYVTSGAKFRGYISPSMGGFIPVPSSSSELNEAEATTVVYIENFVPTPTPTITPLVTATSTATATATATPNPAENAEVIFEKGNTTDLVDCSGTEFAFTVKDPEGVKAVYIEFAVAGFDTDFSKIAATLDLTNTGGDTWSGIFKDTISTKGQVTYWRVVVVDNNGIKTVHYEDGKFSFYARNKSCT